MVKPRAVALDLVGTSVLVPAESFAHHGGQLADHIEAVPRLEGVSELQAFALEVSHHVRQKVLGVRAERPENVVLIAPKTVAARLVAAQNVDQQKAAALEAEIYVNGQSASLWPGEKPTLAEAGQPAREKTGSSIAAQTYNPVRLPGALQVAPPYPPLASPPSPAQDKTPEALPALQASYQPTLERMVKELDKEAHFVAYAPPVFIEFHKNRYLQLSITTTFEGHESGSQYRLAALAFDQHVAHLIRPVLSYFKDSANFDGINFSTSERVGDKSLQAVEFIFPLATLRAYEQYDLTGQQLINAGFVLLNGERVSLDLQNAEAIGR